MTEEQAKEAQICIELLAETYGRHLKSGAFQGYCLVLSELEPHEIRAATERAIREEKFFPSPAVLRQHARALHTQANSALPPETGARMSPAETREIADLGAMYRSRWAAREAGVKLSTEQLADVLVTRGRAADEAMRMAAEAVQTCAEQDPRADEPGSRG